MRTSLRFALALLWLATGFNAYANPLPDTGDLHQHPAWLTLVHYQPDRFGDGYTSQADDDSFSSVNMAKPLQRRNLKPH